MTHRLSFYGKKANNNRIKFKFKLQILTIHLLEPIAKLRPNPLGDKFFWCEYRAEAVET
jgi:hypothetical protein